METTLIMWVLFGGMVMMTIVMVVSLGQYMKYKEREKMCIAMVKSFEKCPECYIQGAEWLSEQWVREMEILGVDFGRG